MTDKKRGSTGIGERKKKYGNCRKRMGMGARTRTVCTLYFMICIGFVCLYAHAFSLMS